MRATRAVIGSLGAGVSLAIASSVALLVVSSVVAFRGWPGAPSVPRVGDVATLTDSGTVSRHARPGVVASVTLPAAAAVPAPARTAPRGRHVTVAGADGTSTGTAAPGGSTAASTPAAGSATAPTKTSAGAGVVSQTGKQTADVVRKTTQAVGQTVAPVAPPVGRTLEQLGAAGGDTVQQVTDTAGKLLP